MRNRRGFIQLLASACGWAAGAGLGSAESLPADRPIVPQPTITGDAKTLTIALMQAMPSGNDQQRNLETAERYCRQASQRGADVLLMPEMWNIGYQGIASFSTDEISPWQDQAIPSDGEWVGQLRELAKELNMAIAATYLQQWPVAPRNCVSLIDRHGEIVLSYAKVHTCDFAFEAALTPGESWPVVELDTTHGSVRVGAMICFDREFPESMRSLMLGGAEVVLVPNACPLDALRLAQLQVRAYENATAVAIANYPAPMHNGQSTAYSAAGASLLKGEEPAGLYFAVVDLPALRTYRQTTIWGNAWRKPHRYTGLTSHIDLEIFKRDNAYGQPFDAQQR